MKTTSFFYPALAVMMFAATSCSTDANEPPKPPVPPAKIIEIKPDYQAKTTNNRLFALDLFKAMAAESSDGNLFVSPFSVNTALNMLWNGAEGRTAEEISLALGNETYTKEQINDYSKTLTDALLNVDPTTDISIANSIWADNTTPFLPSFVETNTAFYNAEVRNVDFTDTETFNVIDRWCLDNTDNKIDNISDGMTVDTRFALINAIYFKSKWVTEFDKSQTRDEKFTNADGTMATVKMMNLEEEFQYSDDEADWKMLSMPYGNGAFSMVFLMPFEDEPLDQKLATLTVDKYYGLFNSLYPYPVTVKLPKFKAEYSYDLQNNILPEMGMVQVFDDELANLSSMCEVPMYVKVVKHKTYIDVYEEGTEAAGATSVSGEVTTAFPPGTDINFFANRPFIYSIVENSTGTILFMGMMSNF